MYIPFVDSCIKEIFFHLNLYFSFFPSFFHADCWVYALSFFLHVFPACIGYRWWLYLDILTHLSVCLCPIQPFSWEEGWAYVYFCLPNTYWTERLEEPNKILLDFYIYILNRTAERIIGRLVYMCCALVAASIVVLFGWYLAFCCTWSYWKESKASIDFIETKNRCRMLYTYTNTLCALNNCQLWKYNVAWHRFCVCANWVTCNDNADPDTGYLSLCASKRLCGGEKMLLTLRWRCLGI